MPGCLFAWLPGCFTTGEPEFSPLPFFLSQESQICNHSPEGPKYTIYNIYVIHMSKVLVRDKE